MSVINKPSQKEQQLDEKVYAVFKAIKCLKSYCKKHNLPLEIFKDDGQSIRVEMDKEETNIYTE